MMSPVCSIMARAESGETGYEPLKIELQRKLDLPRRACEIRRISGARNRGHCRRADRRIRIVELRRVENIECLQAGLQEPSPVGGGKRGLFEVHVQLVLSGPGRSGPPPFAH